MADHARVTGVTDPEPWLLEKYLITTLDVPLNLEGNSRNRFHPKLTAIRKVAVARANAPPIVANPSVGGR